MTLDRYLQNVRAAFARGTATEHSYRSDLQQLIESIVPEVAATNEPKRQACGAPDYILTKNDIPVGFIETKNIGDKDLEGKKKKGGNKEQFDRYKKALDNLIFTDYLHFYFFTEGEIRSKISVGELSKNEIRPLPENFAAFENRLKDFCLYVGRHIENPQQLARMMAGKARMLSEVIGKALISDEQNRQNSTLDEQFSAFRKMLIHDIKAEGFADVYAQTIAYGMFAARLQDRSLTGFDRRKAAELIPKSNPFLRKLFGYIAGPEIDDRIKWIVDSLADIFLAVSPEGILKNYGKATQTEEPIIHFYETFLAEYDPALRKSRGVWYTPQPVVNFIVRAADEILKTDFGLKTGLADTSKVKIKTSENGQIVENEVHRLQILDPAAGTGTFLAETVRQIYRHIRPSGAWEAYVPEHLLPRLNGFELLMASYAMAHLKLGLILKETGYRSETADDRLRIFLTNSLEEGHTELESSFADWLSREANEANRIKKKTPVMCVIGNPPYSGESQNKGPWISDLMEDYKKEPGGREKLKERNPKWINDDYVKFIRFGQHFIEKNGQGVLAFINPHGFLDNPTFRGMRWNLLKTYDKIYTIDLHGNSKKKEIAPDGSADQNVFDIMQGVSINIFVKTGKKKAEDLGKLYHFDLYGKRNNKYGFLSKKSIKSVRYKQLKPAAPNYYFVPKDFGLQKKYEKHFELSKLFSDSSVGIVTARDHFIIDESEQDLFRKLEDFTSLPPHTLSTKYGINENKNWSVRGAKEQHLRPEKRFIQKINYRPFDKRYIYYNEVFIERSRREIMSNFIDKENLGLALCKQYKSGNIYKHFIISDKIIESSLVSNKTSEIASFLPLYIYPENPKPPKQLSEKDTKNLEAKSQEFKAISSTAKATLKSIKALMKTDKENESLQKLHSELENRIREAAAELLKIESKLNPEPAENGSLFAEEARRPNLNPEIVRKIGAGLGLHFTAEKEETPGTFTPLDLLDYIYAVLHSPIYREKYKEFLKIDFPRLPYPTDAKTFGNWSD